MTKLALASALALSGACLAAPALDDTARFLAGKPLAPDSQLADLAQAQFSTDHAEQVAAGWNHFQQPNLDRIRAWWPSYAPAKSSTVFYPFSGPDLANALAFFPEADAYLLFGLEPPGAIPDLQGMPDEEISAGLNDLRASLNTIFQVNYFLTKRMEKKLGKGQFNSITGLLLFFLAMNDCEVTGARRIAVGPGATLAQGTAADDSIHWRNPPRSRVPGIEITFRRNGDKVQTVRYFMVNVADASLVKHSPDFLPWIQTQGRVVTLVKSASYLMHQDGPRATARFEQLRALILTQSDFLVQDDSGVPLRFFARDKWRLLFHGHYDTPTPEFARHLQKDLRVEMQRNSTGTLPFSYGYGYKPGASNLMTAESIP